MIDVFSLVHEGVLEYNPSLRKISDVKFCEMDQAVFPEIKEMIGHENAGFIGKLDDIVLFKDDVISSKLGTATDIELEFERLGESMEAKQRNHLSNKLTHLTLRDSFPFDFLNLDFCDPYYLPPDIMRVNKTVERIVDWQKRFAIEGKKQFGIDRFLIAITCRFNNVLSSEARSRLYTIIEANKREYPKFKKQLSTDEARSDIKKWASRDTLDFFMTSWPKEILRIVEQHQWKASIDGLVYYDREDKKGHPYVIVSILCSCQKSKSVSNHEGESLRLLKKESRDKIETVSPNSDEGKRTKEHLKHVVTVRNQQAEAITRAPLPI
jgi:hypothetical protein